MTIEWSGLKDGETVTLTLEKKNGSNYEKVLEKIISCINVGAYAYNYGYSRICGSTQ